MDLDRSRRFTVDNREFHVQLLEFVNGCFLSISEGVSMKLGAITLALKTGDNVDSSIVLPGKYGGIIPTLLAQTAANIKGGITILSLYLASELDSEEMKTMIVEVKNILKK